MSALITWGAIEDFSTWTQTGTCTVSSPVVDPFNGTTAQGIEDNDGAASETRYMEYTAAYTGYHIVTVCIRTSGATTESAIRFQNMTVGSFILGTAVYTWSGAVGTMTIDGGSGVLASVAMGNGYYAQRIRGFATVGDTMRVTIYPAGLTASSTGHIGCYMQNMVFLGPLDNVTAWEDPREGSSWAQGGSGVEDAWIQGTDFRYRFDLPWIPHLDRDSPEVATGWNGPYERVGVNCGIQAMLAAGRRKETLTFWESHVVSTALEGVASYLVAPLNGAPSLQPNGDRSITLELRNTSKRYKPIALT